MNASPALVTLAPPGVITVTSTVSAAPGGDDAVIDLSSLTTKAVGSGRAGAGDAIETLARESPPVPVSEVTRLYASERGDVAGLRRVLEADALPEAWRLFFEESSWAERSKTAALS